MKNSQPYKLGIRGLCLIAFFRLVLLMYLYYKLRIAFATSRIPIKIFNWLEITQLLLVIVEALLYAWLQKSIKAKLWVRLHVWSLAFVLLLMPLIIIGIVFIIQYFDITESRAIIKSINWIKFYLSWGFTIVGHGAFIVVLVKSLQKKNETAPIPETGGILDEFTTE